jgi:hypothetical protein
LGVGGTLGCVGGHNRGGGVDCMFRLREPREDLLGVPPVLVRLDAPGDVAPAAARPRRQAVALLFERECFRGQLVDALAGLAELSSHA